MSTKTGNELFLRYTKDVPARPIPGDLAAARDDVLAAADALTSIPDGALTTPWPWTGDSVEGEEVRYGFYRIAEAFELAGIEAGSQLRSAGVERGAAAERIAPATAAAWDLRGLLAPIAEALWDADPGADEWTIRQTLGHVIGGQRQYAVGVGWWLDQGFRVDDLTRPSFIPEKLWDELPSDEEEAEGTRLDVERRLTEVLDIGTERLAGSSVEQLATGARWSGYPIDIGFRLGRWASHIREHTIQVEKTFAMLDHQPTEVDRLIRLVLAAWGRAESVVYGSAPGVAAAAIQTLAAAAAAGRSTAADIAAVAKTAG
jgi:DinB superfamily